MGDTMVISDGQYYDTYIGHSKELEQIKFPNDVFYSEEYKKQQKQLQKQMTKKMQGIVFKFQENVGYSGIQEGMNVGIRKSYQYSMGKGYLSRLGKAGSKIPRVLAKAGKAGNLIKIGPIDLFAATWRVLNADDTSRALATEITGYGGGVLLVPEPELFWEGLLEVL